MVEGTDPSEGDVAKGLLGQGDGDREGTLTRL